MVVGMKIKLLAAITFLIFCGCSTVIRKNALENDPESMSETTRFLHPRIFPFCISEANENASALMSGIEDQWDYVELTQAEAMHFWWNLETLEINASIGDLILPTDIGGDSPNSALGGSIIAAGFSFPSDPLSTAAPNTRVCADDFSSTILQLQRDTGFYSWNALFTLVLAYDEGSESWRAYYFFDFEITDDVAIVNQSNGLPDERPTWSLLTDGVFTMGGKDFYWSAYIAPDSMTTGASLDMTAEFFTYPAP